MMQLQWREAPDNTPVHNPSTSDHSADNPWFAVTMGLIGVIVGYIVAAL